MKFLIVVVHFGITLQETAGHTNRLIVGDLDVDFWDI